MNLSFQTPVRFQLVQTSSQIRSGDPSSPSEQPQRRWMAFVILLGFAWRMLGLTTRSLGQDEVETLRLSTRPLDEIFTMITTPEQNGAIYYLLMRPWLQFFGDDPFSLRYTSVLIGTITIALMWQVARRMVPGGGRTILSNLPLLSTLFLAINPYQLSYSQEGSMLALILALTLLSSWSWLQAMWHSGPWRWLSYLLITSISIHTHLITVLVVPVHLIWFLLANPLNRQRWKGYLLTLGGFLLPALSLAGWDWRTLISADYSSYSSSLPFIPLAEMTRTLLLNHAQGVLDPISHIWLIPIFFLGLTGLLVGYTEFGGRIANVGMLVTWLILPVLIIFAISLVTPIFIERYVIWIAPAFSMFLALGAQVMRRAYGRLGVWITWGLILFVVGFWGYSTWEQAQRPFSFLLGAAPHTQPVSPNLSGSFDNAAFDNRDARLS